MSTEHVGEVKVHATAYETNEQKAVYAEVLIVDSNDITEEEAREWRDAGLEFLSNLSKESFQLRFGSPKPHDIEGLIPLADYFAFSRENHHQMVLLTYEGRLIGAASIFDYRLRERHGANEIADTEHVVELSVTIADDYQGQGLGADLLKIAAQAAADSGKTHVYTSFNPENDRSRKLVQSVLGSANIVAGIHNIQDKFWRLPNVSSRDYTDLERVMQQFCGDIERTEIDADDESSQPLTQRARDLGREAVRRLRIRTKVLVHRAPDGGKDDG